MTAVAEQSYWCTTWSIRSKQTSVINGIVFFSGTSKLFIMLNNVLRWSSEIQGRAIWGTKLPKKLRSRVFLFLSFVYPFHCRWQCLALTCSHAHHPALGYPVPLAWLCSSGISAWFLIGLLPHRRLPHFSIFKKNKSFKQCFKNCFTFEMFFLFISFF